jgi:hypothetical protein
MNPTQLYQWNEHVSSMFPCLGKWQAQGLAFFSAGVMLAERCTLSKVAEALLLVGKPDSQERRLQRWISNERIDVTALSRCWIEQVVQSMASERWVLLVDETKLSQHLSVMVVGVAYQSSCIPLIWRCYHAEAYPSEGQVGMIRALLTQVVACIPAHYRLTLQADRGLGTSPELIEAVEQLGMTFLFRVQGSCRLRQADGTDVALKELARVGEVQRASGQVFKKHGWLSAHVRVVWAEGYDDVWCLVTNDPHIQGSEYALRYWQEASFRDLKSDGWHWQRSQVWQPAHAQRLLFMLVLAYAWTLTHGLLVQQASPVIQALVKRGKRRVYSLFRLGLRYMRRLLHDQLPLALALVFVPEPGACKSVVT